MTRSFSKTLTTLTLHSPVGVDELLERLVGCDRLEMLYLHNVGKANAVQHTDVLFVGEEENAMDMDVDVDADMNLDNIENIPPRSLEQRQHRSRRVLLPSLVSLGIISHANIPLSQLLQGLLLPTLFSLEIVTDDPVDPIDVHQLLVDSWCGTRLQVFGLSCSSTAGVLKIDSESTKTWLGMGHVTPDSQGALCGVKKLRLLGMEMDEGAVKMLERHIPSILPSPPPTPTDCDPYYDYDAIRQQQHYCLFPDLEDVTLGTIAADVDPGVVMRMLGSRFFNPPVPSAHAHLQAHQQIAELKKAAVKVRTLTREMDRYATMLRDVGQRSKGKESRLIFDQD